MAEVAKERPKYPVEFIINYLRANNPENDDKGKSQTASQKPKNKSPQKQVAHPQQPPAQQQPPA